MYGGDICRKAHVDNLMISALNLRGLGRAPEAIDSGLIVLHQTMVDI